VSQQSTATELSQRLITLFKKKYKADSQINNLIRQAEGKQVDHILSDKYANRIGEILEACINECEEDLLNLEETEENFKEVFFSLLEACYKMSASYCALIQSKINTRAGINIKAEIPEVDSDRLEGIIKWAVKDEEE